MSTYTPCFPPTDVPLSGRLRPISSTSSGASTSGSHALPEVSYAARLSRSHLALASVSEYFPRPPSPTSTTVDIKRVTQLRRKFRLAIDATYRDTSSGKWAHVSEMAKLGSTRGRWQGMCSGSSASYSLYKADKHNHQGIAAESADPYPRPPVPIFDPREIRERVENWQVNVLSAPLTQVHRLDSELYQSTHVGDAKQPSSLNFPIVKQRRRDVSKSMKCKGSPSRKDHSTSRYFRGVTDPKFADSHVVNSPAEALGENADTARRGLPTSDTAAGPKNIQQVSELFLPPSFPSHLQTSTPPPLLTTKSTHSPLSKPPEIPRNEELCFSASLPSPLPFPLSQPVDGNQGSESQPNGSPSLSRHKRPFQDTSSPAGSLSKRWRQSPLFEKPTPKLSLNEPHDVRRHDRDLPVIDLRQAMSSQRSRAKSGHPSHGINPMTHRTTDKGKGRAMTVDISHSQLGFLSPPGIPRSLGRVSSPHLRTPPHSQTNFTQDADVFAQVAAASTQPPLAKGLPRAGNEVFALSESSQPAVEAYGLPVGASSAVDFAAWMVDMPVLDGSQENDGHGHKRRRR